VNNFAICATRNFRRCHIWEFITRSTQESKITIANYVIKSSAGKEVLIVIWELIEARRNLPVIYVKRNLFRKTTWQSMWRYIWKSNHLYVFCVKKLSRQNRICKIICFHTQGKNNSNVKNVSQVSSLNTIYSNTRTSICVLWLPQQPILFLRN
jgi:hypothetical protein